VVKHLPSHAQREAHKDAVGSERLSLRALGVAATTSGTKFATTKRTKYFFGEVLVLRHT
jgi:hypothetical protein